MRIQFYWKNIPEYIEDNFPLKIGVSSAYGEIASQYAGRIEGDTRGVMQIKGLIKKLTDSEVVEILE